MNYTQIDKDHIIMMMNRNPSDTEPVSLFQVRTLLLERFLERHLHRQTPRFVPYAYHGRRDGRGGGVRRTEGGTDRGWDGQGEGRTEGGKEGQGDVRTHGFQQAWNMSVY